MIQTREEPTTPLLGGVDIVGMIPPSTKDGLDDAVFGVAFWVVDNDLAQADAFKVYVRGLSDSLQVITPPGGGSPSPSYKTLRIDFSASATSTTSRRRRSTSSTRPTSGSTGDRTLADPRQTCV